MTNEFEEAAAMEGRRAIETPAQFVARLDLVDRVSPALEEIANHGWAVVVESNPGSAEASFSTDFILQYGDARLRLLLFPGTSAPFDDRELVSRLRHFILEFPDTDGVVVVADDEVASAWVVDVYDIDNALTGQPETRGPGSPILEALRGYAANNLFAVDFPDFKQIVSLPRQEQLEQWLADKATSHFSRVSGQRARIPEKVAALETLTGGDLHAIQELLLAALAGDEVSPVTVVGEDDD